jgi:hypothetical protein
MELERSHSCPAIWRRPMELQALHTFPLLNFYKDVHLYSTRALGMLY